MATEAKELERDKKAWELRVLHIKTDLESLERRKKTILEGIDAARVDAEKRIQEKLDALKAESDRLEGERESFKGSVKSHQSDKSSLAQERSSFLRDQKAMLELVDKANSDLKKVREFSALLKGFDL